MLKLITLQQEVLMWVKQQKSNLQVRVKLNSRMFFNSQCFYQKCWT